MTKAEQIIQRQHAAERALGQLRDPHEQVITECKAARRFESRTPVNGLCNFDATVCAHLEKLHSLKIVSHNKGPDMKISVEEAVRFARWLLEMLDEPASEPAETTTE